MYRTNPPTLALGFLWALTIAILSGCAGPRYHANDKLEKQRYLEAYEAYSELLRKNPADEEAEAKKLEAAEGWVGTVLAEAQSQMGNWKVGATTLKGALTLKSKLKIRPPLQKDFQRYFDQTMSMYLDALTLEVKKCISDKHPFPCLRTLDEFSFFSEILDPGLFESLNREAQIQCTEKLGDQGFKDTLKTPHYADLMLRLCRDRGIELGSIRKQVDEGFTQELRALQVEIAVSDMPHSSLLHLGEMLQKAFATTGWYHRAGKRILIFSVDGHFKEARSRTLIEVKGPAKSKSRSTTWSNELRLEVSLRAKAHVGPHEIPFSHRETFNETIIESAGRATDAITTTDSWLAAQFEVFLEEFKERSKKLWTEEYCTHSKLKGPIREVSLKCARGRPVTFPNPMESWAQSEFGMTLSELALTP